MDSQLNLAVQVVEELQEWIQDHWKGKDDEIPVVEIYWTVFCLAISVGGIGVWCDQVHDTSELTMEFCQREYLLHVKGLIQAFDDCKIPDAPEEEFNPESN